MREICQNTLPLRPWAEARTARLPGLNPVAPGDWLIADEAYGAQMGYREALLRARRGDVVRMAPEARPAADELLQAVLAQTDLMDGFTRVGEAVTCPDGRVVRLDRDDPLGTCGRLVQEDFALMQVRDPDRGGEHMLTGAVLCFPASWTLDEKFLRPLTAIHGPVAAYDANIARRVQRLFDAIRPGAPIWRANALIYDDPDLHQPRREGARRRLAAGGPRWLRIERQTLARLPGTGAVAFAIHTYVLPLSALDPADRNAVLQHAALSGDAPAG